MNFSIDGAKVGIKPYKPKVECLFFWCQKGKGLHGKVPEYHKQN